VAGAVTNPIMGEIRLTWWLEAIAEIFEDKPVRRHPVVEALASAIERRKLPRGPFEAMVEARFPELDGVAPDSAATEGPLMALAGLSLGQEHPALAQVAAGALSAARSLPPKLFPVAAHLALRDSQERSAFSRRLRITLAVLRGRL